MFLKNMEPDIACKSKKMLSLDSYKYVYKCQFAQNKHLAGEGKI